MYFIVFIDENYIIIYFFYGFSDTIFRIFLWFFMAPLPKLFYEGIDTDYLIFTIVSCNKNNAFFIVLVFDFFIPSVINFDILVNNY